MGGIFLVFVEGVGLVVHLFWKDFREKQQLEVKWSELRLCRYASRYFLCSHLYSILLVVFEYSIFYYLVRAVRATIYFVQTSCLLIHCVLVFILFFFKCHWFYLKEIYMWVHIWIWCLKSCPCLRSNPF